jgi:hypothetical protein
MLIRLVSMMLLVSALFVPSTPGQSKPADPRDKILLDFETKWCEAFKNRDKTSLERILSDQFIFTDDRGKVFNKKTYIAMALEQLIKSYRNIEHEIRYFGNVAVISISSVWEFTAEGKPTSGSYRSLDVFELKNGYWQAVASQDTRIIP